MTKQLLLALAFCLTVGAEEATFVSKLADINISSFPWEDTRWSSFSYRDFLEKHMKRRLESSPKERRRKAFAFYKAFEKKHSIDYSDLIDAEATWNNLTLFCGQQNKQTYVAHSLSRTKSELGTLAQFLVLASPTNDVHLLKKRQKVLQTMLSDEPLYDQLDELFSSICLAETTFLSFYDTDPLEEGVTRMSGFSKGAFERLNKSANLLLIKSWSSHMKQLSAMGGTLSAAGICMLYGVATLANNNQLSKETESWTNTSMGGLTSPTRWLWNYGTPKIKALLALGTGITLGMVLKPIYTWTTTSFFYEKCIHDITNQLAAYMATARKTYELIRDNEELAGFDEFKPLIEFFEKQIHESEDLKEFCDLLATSTFRKKPIALSHKGRVARVFMLMHELKEKLVPLAASMGAVDCYRSYAELMKEFKEKNVNFCFPTYLTEDAPEIHLEDFWHPLLDPETVVANSVTLGNGQRNNMIITGPNAGGKSTIMKAIALSVYLGQTIGIAPAAKMNFTLFSKLKIYLNIVDDIGAGNSLFMAEAQQAQRIIDTVEKAGPQEFVFTCFDEVFNGTSPVEGSAAAYSVAEHLGRFGSAISLIATHFPLLTQLEAASSSFKNYKVSVNIQEDGLQYPYKLQEGSSRQHVALDVLKQEGIDGSLVAEAQKHLDAARRTL